MDPVDYRPGPQGQQVPVYNNATPGPAGAIHDFVAALTRAFAPKSITQRSAKLDQGVEQNDASNPPKLGDSF
jgi:hypothetical protein